MQDKLKAIREALEYADEKVTGGYDVMQAAFDALAELEQMQVQIFVEDGEIMEVQWQGGTLDYEIINDPFTQGMFYCERCSQWKLDKYLSFYSDDCSDCCTATESEENDE